VVLRRLSDNSIDQLLHRGNIIYKPLSLPYELNSLLKIALDLRRYSQRGLSVNLRRRVRLPRLDLTVALSSLAVAAPNWLSI
jgi:hypothetical protein